jgi:hypothetical protein
VAELSAVIADLRQDRDSWREQARFPPNKFLRIPPDLSPVSIRLALLFLLRELLTRPIARRANYVQTFIAASTDLIAAIIRAVGIVTVGRIAVAAETVAKFAMLMAAMETTEVSRHVAATEAAAVCPLAGRQKIVPKSQRSIEFFVIASLSSLGSVVARCYLAQSLLRHKGSAS